MVEEKRMPVDAGIDGSPIPISASSKVNPDGQRTNAQLSSKTRVFIKDRMRLDLEEEN